MKKKKWLVTLLALSICSYVHVNAQNRSKTQATVKIAGTYSTVNEEDDIGKCDIKVVISKQKDGYYYDLRTDKRHKKGKVKLTKSDAQYISFMDLPAGENNGDLHGLLTENEILIQNTGNSMNEYTRLSECDRKYIRLVKQKAK
jgi:uncharacterized protein (DUF2225 family)